MYDGAAAALDELQEAAGRLVGSDLQLHQEMEGPPETWP